VERLTKLGLEDRVQDGIDSRVDVAEPEEEGVQLSRDSARRAPAVDDVDREETEPRAAQHSHYDGSSYGRPRLEMFGVAYTASPSNHDIRTCSRRLLIRTYYIPCVSIVMRAVDSFTTQLGLKCPSVRPSVREQKGFSISLKFGM